MRVPTNLSRLTLMDRAKIVEPIELHGMVEMVNSMDPQIVAQCGVALIAIGSAGAQVASHVDVPILNRVVSLGLNEPVTEALLDAVAAAYQDDPVRFMVQMSPAILNDDLHRRLEARGWVRSDNWAKMFRGPELPPGVSTDLRIERVGAEHREAIADVVCDGFEVPRELGGLFSNLVGRHGWTHYVAFDGDEPVATGALLVRVGIACLDYGATRASHRRRGAQGAIMAQRIRDAIDLGCRWITTETGEDTPEQPNQSYRNMVRLGFQLAYLRPNYIRFPSPG